MRERSVTPAMVPATRSAVLHLSDAQRDGVDRYIRDIAQGAQRRHLLWLQGAGIDAIEDIATQNFLPLPKAVEGPLAAIAQAEWLLANGVGVIHLHRLGTLCRERLALLQSVRATPCIVTLHDLTFIHPRALATSVVEPDFAWIAETSDTLARAATVIAPSAYVRDLALRHFPNGRFAIVEPGIGHAQGNEGLGVPADFTVHRRAHVAAVIGAIVTHEERALLDALVGPLDGTDLSIVVIGSADSRGWRAQGRCYVHGEYVDAELPALLAAYGVEVALLPNRLPECFSYTLSEVWSAGIPVIVAEDGALGERVSQHQGGWVLPARFSAQEAAQLLQRLFAAAGNAERTRVRSQIDPRDPVRIPTLASMARDIDALYERFGLRR
jgi:hypothetical protein